MKLCSNSAREMLGLESHSLMMGLLWSARRICFMPTFLTLFSPGILARADELPRSIPNKADPYVVLEKAYPWIVNGRVVVDKVPKRTFEEWWSFTQESLAFDKMDLEQHPSQVIPGLCLKGSWIMMAIEQSPDRVDWANRFVARFGKRGTESDIKWLMCVRGLEGGLCPNGVIKVHADLAGKIEAQVRNSRVFESALYKAVTVRMLNDASFLEKYCYAVAWDQRSVRADLVQNAFGIAGQLLKSGDRDEYWAGACVFAVLAYICSEEKLLDNADAEKLLPRFEFLRKRFIEQGMFLRAKSREPRWYLDQGEGDREEAFVPFLKKGHLPRLQVMPALPVYSTATLQPSPLLPRNHIPEDGYRMVKGQGM